MTKLLFQFEGPNLTKGALHYLYTQNETDYHCVVLLHDLQYRMYHSIHDGLDHQSLECTLALLT